MEFILLHKPGRRWPAEQDPRFWDSAAEYMYVAMRSKRDAICIYNIHVIIMPRMQLYHVTSLTRPASSVVEYMAHAHFPQRKKWPTTH